MAQLNPQVLRLGELAYRASLKAREGRMAARRAFDTIRSLFAGLPSVRRILAVAAIVGLPLAGALALSRWVDASSTVGVIGAQPGTSVSAVAWSQEGRYAAIGTHDGHIHIWDPAARRSVGTLQAPGSVMALKLYDEAALGRPPSLRLFARTVGGPGQLQEQLRRLARAIEVLARQKPRDEDVQRMLQMMAMLQQQEPQDEDVQRLQRLVEQQGLQLQQQQQQQQQQQLPPNVSTETVPNAADVRTRVMEWIVALDGSVLQSRQLAVDGDPATGRYLYVAPARSGSSGGSAGGGTNAPPPRATGPFLVLDDRYPSGMSAYARSDKELPGRITAATLADDGSTLSVLGLDSGHILVEGERRRVLSPPGVAVTALAAGPTTQVFFSATAGGNVARHGLAGDGTMQLFGSRPWTVTPGPVLSGHSGPLVADIAADGSRVVTASHEGVLQLWDLRQVPPRAAPNPQREPVTHLALSDDGSLLLTASQNGNLRAWSLRGDAGFARDLRGHRGAVMQVALSPDRTLAASASDDGTVRVWDLRQTSDPVLLQAGAQVNHVAFGPDGGLVVAACEDGTVRVWRLGTSEVTVLEGHRKAVRRARFSPDGAWILTVAEGEAAHLWRVGGNIPTLLAIRGATFLDGVFSSDSSQIALSSADGDVWLWRFRDRQMPALDPIGLKGPGRAAWSPSFGPQGRSLLVGYADGTAALWDLSGAVPRATTLRGHGKAVTQAKILGDGLVVFTASADGTARLWQVQNTVSAHGAPVTGLHSIVLSPDAVFARIKKQMQTFAARQLALSNELSRMGAENSRQQAGANREDLDRRLAEIQQEMAVLEQQLQQFQRYAEKPVDVWSVAENGEAMLWSERTDVPVVTLEHGARVAASGATEGLLFTAGDDGIVRLRDAETGSLVGTIAGHAAPLTHAAISAQARYLLSADADGVVRISDIGRARWIWRMEGWPDALPRVSTMFDDLMAMVRGEGNGRQAGTGQPVQQQPGPTSPGPTAK